MIIGRLLPSLRNLVSITSYVLKLALPCQARFEADAPLNKYNRDTFYTQDPVIICIILLLLPKL